MERFLEKMLRLPMDIMISSMETMARTLHDIQRKAESGDESSSRFDTDKGKDKAKPGMLGNVPRLALTPLFEMYKIPTSGLVSGFETLSNAVDEIRHEPAEKSSRRAEKRDDDEIVALDDEEAETERRVGLSGEFDEASGRTLWRIGRPGCDEHDEEWTAEFDYHVDEEIERLDSPRIPHLLTVQGGPRSDGATEKLNVHFTLDRDYGPGELVLDYDRWGGEKDKICVDDELLSPVRGAGRGKLRHVALSLGHLSRGKHVITLTASGDTTDKEHRIDCLRLSETEPRKP